VQSRPRVRRAPSFEVLAKRHPKIRGNREVRPVSQGQPWGATTSQSTMTPRRLRAVLGNPVPSRPWVGALGYHCAIQSESATSTKARRCLASGSRPRQGECEGDVHDRSTGSDGDQARRRPTWVNPRLGDHLAEGRQADHWAKRSLRRELGQPSQSHASLSVALLSRSKCPHFLRLLVWLQATQRAAAHQPCSPATP